MLPRSVGLGLREVFENKKWREIDKKKKLLKTVSRDFETPKQTRRHKN